MEKKKYYIVYQITNKLNNKIYIGVHVTENIKDKYMGSGSNIKKAIKEFGIENFEKIILFNFDNKEDMLEKEKELVNNEFIKNGDTYNIMLGGNGFNSQNLVNVKDKNGNTQSVHITDPRYLSGELVGINKGMVIVKDENNNYLRVCVDDDRYLSGELSYIHSGMIPVKDKNGIFCSVPINDKRFLSGELVGCSKYMITVKDKNNNILNVSTSDPRYLSDELKPIWIGKRHKEETKKKMSEIKKGKYKGKESSQYGTCWVYNLEKHENKKIKLDNIKEWLSNGWVKGRKMII